MQFDRATAYHSIYRAEELLSMKDGHYVLSVQRWKSIMDEFEPEINKVQSMLRHETTQSIILDVVSKHSKELAVQILNNVINQIQS